MISILIVIPIILPIAAGVVVEFFKPLKTANKQNAFFACSLALTFVSIIIAVVLPDMRLELFNMADRMPIIFVSDDPARLFCILAGSMFLFAGIYACGHLQKDKIRRRFYMFFLLTLGMLMGFGFSGNLITLYLFFEIMTLCSVPLVLHSMQRNAVAAAFKFLFYAIAGAALVLVALFVLYARVPSLEFSAGGVLNSTEIAGYENQILFVSILAILGFGAKAGMFPLHGWLPDAHPVAPAPASAVLSGVITKAGVFAVFRFVFYIIGPEIIKGTWVQTVWILLSLFTILMGALLAYRETVFKRRIAYSSISQVNYIMFAMATLTAIGVTGALLQIVFHSILKNALFFTAGSIIYISGSTDVAGLRGIGKRIPVTMWCFTLLAITAVGVPLTSGFVSKWYILSGSLSAEIGVYSWLGPVVLLSSAVLSAGYLLPISVSGLFDEGPGSEIEGQEPGLLMLLPIIFLTIACVVFGMFPGSLVSFIEKIASSIVY